MTTKISKHTIFTEEVCSFTLPNFDFYKDKIKQIIKVEENIASSAPEKKCNVIAQRTEDTDAKFIFNSNRRTVLQKKDDKATNFSNLKFLTPKNGTVIFFDGSVMHSVSPNKSNKTRITAAFNFRPQYLENR